MDACPAVAHPEVVHRPHVGSVELKEQEHLSRPGSDAPHGDQARDDLVVAEVVEIVRWDRPVGELRREVDDRCELVG
jgi:hypothetical protein